MVVSGGKLRPATDEEVAALGQREVVSWELTRLPGIGTEGLAALLAEGDASAATEGLVITCTCGHLFLDELPRS
jgi:hypothetical protein